MFFPYRSILIPIQFDDPSPLALGLGSFSFEINLCQSHRGKRDDIRRAARPQIHRQIGYRLIVWDLDAVDEVVWFPSTANELLIRPSDVRVPGVTIVGVK